MDVMIHRVKRIEQHTRLFPGRQGCHAFSERKFEFHCEDGSIVTVTAFADKIDALTVHDLGQKVV